MATAPAQIDEETLVRQKIAELSLPDGVKFKRLEQTNDWEGDPSLRIYFSVSKHRPQTPKHIRELSSLTFDLQSRILQLGLGKYPFITFVDGK